MPYVSDAVTCVSLTRDGQCLVVSSADNMVRLLDKESGDMLGEWVVWIKQEFSDCGPEDHNVNSQSWEP